MGGFPEPSQHRLATLWYLNDPTSDPAPSVFSLTLASSFISVALISRHVCRRQVGTALLLPSALKRHLVRSLLETEFCAGHLEIE